MPYLTLALLVEGSARGHEIQLLAPTAYAPVSISGDGRFVAFVETIGWDNQVWVIDRVTGDKVLISAFGDGSPGPGNSPSLSYDGRFVAFQSDASLLSSDVNGDVDVFMRDRDPDGDGVFDEGNSVTELISIRKSGKQGKRDSYYPSISTDGVRVAFVSDAANLADNDNNQTSDVFVKDRATGNLFLVSWNMSRTGTGNYGSYLPFISADGRFVIFTSAADDLAPNDTNGFPDVFSYEIDRDSTVPISVDPSGALVTGWSGSPSRTGRFVALTSGADGLVPDDNGFADVFWIDRDPDGNGTYDEGNSVIERASVSSSGGEPDANCLNGVISADGSKVAFQTMASTLAQEDTNGVNDVFLRDIGAQMTTLASMNCAHAVGDFDSIGAAVSEDGSLVVFLSWANNLVADDDHSGVDVFVADFSVSDTDASSFNYGNGFPGTNGIPGFVASADPIFGSSIDLHVDNSLGDKTPAIILAGLDDASVTLGTGATILVDFVLILPVSVASGGSDFAFDVLRDPIWCDLTLYLQAIELDPGAIGGMSFTPGLALVLGL